MVGTSQWASAVGVGDAALRRGVGVQPSVHETRYESVLVRLRGDEDPRTEWLWATVVDASDSGGMYRLANSGFHSPLVLDDIVEVRRNRHGRLQVIGVHARGGRPGWLIHLEVDDAAEGLIAQWRATGTVVQGDGWTVSVALDAAGLAARPTAAELADLYETGLVLGHLRLSDGSVLTDDEAEWMDFHPQ